MSVLYAAVEKYGSPEALVTDGGGIFRARQARAVYEGRTSSVVLSSTSSPGILWARAGG
jgi:hypothetical protein